MKMEKFPWKSLGLPDGWAEKLFDSPKEVASRKPTSAFLQSLLDALNATPKTRVKPAHLARYLNVDRAMVHRWIHGVRKRQGRYNCEPQGMSEAEAILDNWAKRISVIQYIRRKQQERRDPIAPEEWDSIIRTLRAFSRSREE